MFGNYQELISAIAAWLNRNDSATLNAIPGFIDLAEADIRSEVRTRAPVVSEGLTVSPGNETVTLPGGVGEIRGVSIVAPNTHQGELEVVPFQKIETLRREHRGARTPRWFAVVNGVLHLAPVPGIGCTLRVFYEPQLTSLRTAGTNWVLQHHPNLYLYGALKHSAPFFRDDARRREWEQLYEYHLSRIELERDRHELGSSPLQGRFRAIGS